MQKLLLSTALVASSMFAGAAFAQTFTPVTDASGNPLYTWTDASGNLVQGTYTQYTTALNAVPDPDGPGPLTAADAQAAFAARANVTALGSETGPYASDSLLDGILQNATALSASLSNVAQNLNNVNGDIDITTDRTMSEMDEIITALRGNNPGFGSYSQVSANVFGSDLPASLLAVLNPLTLELGNLSTTAIGSLQSGNLTATVDADGILAKASSTASGSTTGASILSEQYASIADTLAFQNVSLNSGAIDGSINMALNDVNTKVGNLSTTAIGALGSGAMTATIQGQLGTADTTASKLVTSLVGSGG